MKLSIGALFATAAFMLAAAPAEAAIKCDGPYQITKYGRIATPYCGDAEIARVARSYGSHVTAAEVRGRPLTKVRLCQIYGNDIRIKSACGAYAPDQYR
jgi:hypothetical protein